MFLRDLPSLEPQESIIASSDSAFSVRMHKNTYFKETRKNTQHRKIVFAK